MLPRYLISSKIASVALLFSLKIREACRKAASIRLPHYASAKSRKLTSRIKITFVSLVWSWYIKRNNVICLERGLLPSKTPAASYVINSLSFSKGQQPRILNPELKASDAYAYDAKILNITALLSSPFDPINSLHKLCFEISMELLQAVCKVYKYCTVHNLVRITLCKHNYR